MQRTIRHFFTLSILFEISFMLGLCIRNKYMLERGITETDLNVIAIAFVLSKCLADIPTGALADVFGRRWLVFTSCLFNAVSLYGFIACKTPADYCLSNVACGIGAACGSGAFHSWFIDQMKHKGFTGSFDILLTREILVARTTSIIAALVGTVLADVWIILPWVFGGSLLLLISPLVLRLMREDYHTPHDETVCRKSKLADTFRMSLQCVKASKRIRIIIILGMFQSFGIATPDQQWTPLFESVIGEDNKSFGFAWAAMMGAAIVGSAAMDQLARRQKRGGLLVGGQILIGLCLIATVITKQPVTMVTAYLLHEAIRGGWHPIKMAYLNEHIGDAERATVNSCDSATTLAGNLFGLIVGGVMTYYFGRTVVWIAMGLVVVSGCIAARRK